MSEENEQGSAKIKFHKDGRLTQNQDGADVTVATYNRTSGHLELENKEVAAKLYQQITAKIGTRNQGKEPSGLKITSMSVKGEADDALPKNAPKRPRMGQLGDCTPEVVEWFFKWRPKEAIIRYGVFTDENGEMVRKDCRRLVLSLVDRRDQDDDDLPWQQDGKKTRSKSPVAQEGELITEKNAIIARRSTHMTFTPREVIGGFDTEDELAEAVEGGDES